jgi:O-antigen chain-terminating methyltransferase
MKRTLEKLAGERQEKENAFAQKLEALKQKCPDDRPAQAASSLEHVLSRLKELLKKEQEQNRPGKSFLTRLAKTSSPEIPGSAFHEQAFLLLREQQSLLLQNITLSKELFTGLEELIELQAALVDTKDREWDALGSHHVGLIFKSMEWRVDKLAAEYEDVKLLMKKFIQLRDQLDRLLAVLEGGQRPTPAEVKKILEPLEDWRYAGFENRFRGSEEEVKRKLREYVPYFSKEGMVLDLGCGRGEFLELLQESGIAAAGVDISSQMVDICLDKGLRCQKGDILETLAELMDGSLSGIFSSQVIEHLPPVYLQKLLGLAQRKLAPSGAIVLETINPVSVFALVQIYYLDLSHRNPVHPQALKFMLEAAGFENVEIKYSSALDRERLQNLPGADERTAVLNRNIDNLNDLLFAPANFAAIARRK